MNFNRQKSISKLNDFASNGIPFLFLVDFEGKNCIIEALENLDDEEIKFWINGKSNINQSKLPATQRKVGLISSKISSPFSKERKLEIEPTNTARTEDALNKVVLQKSPISFQQYKIAFDLVHKNILQGNSFLTNLTCETPIDLNISLSEVFERSEAKYKIYVKNKFVCFSPEIFVQIDKEGKISSYPMKGTIDAAFSNSEQIILNDKKEFYEHTTIVDLIRNDLSKVARKVWVEKFRYIDRIQTNENQEILQVSSQVSGLLSSSWRENLGEILYEMLPAGSISGAPKEKTLEIIVQAEKYTYPTQFGKLSNNRGFYTGICGIFDGETFDSGVMIRFIEQKQSGLVFKSGGGITSNSIAEKEYEEMIQKIYVPIV